LRGAGCVARGSVDADKTNFRIGHVRCKLFVRADMRYENGDGAAQNCLALQIM
jgi:hypothetical protein